MATTGTARLSLSQQLQQQAQANKAPQGPVLVELRLTEDQAEYLERQFGKTKNPCSSEMMLIAAECCLTDEEVKVWFHHRMAIWRRDQGLNPISTRLC